jgi:cell division protein FtsB
MARRKASEERVSLFPFMSILACLIGILTMMIAVSLAVNQRKEGMAEEEFERAKENRKIQAEVAKKKEEVTELEQKNKTAAEFAKLEEYIIRLRDTLQDLAKAAPDEGDEELQRTLEMLVEETKRLQDEHPVSPYLHKPAEGGMKPHRG